MRLEDLNIFRISLLVAVLGEGHRPRRKTGRRFSLNIVSAISNKGHVEFMILDGTFNGGVFIEFLTRLIKHKTYKIFWLLMDIQHIKLNW